MKICVTGGNGFIGKHTVDLLIGKDHEIRVIDRQVRNWGKPIDGVYTIFADITEAKSLIGIFLSQRPDAVLHLAANSSLQKSVSNAIYDATQNVLGTIAVIGAAQRSGCKRIVFASTSAVYGPRAYGAYTEQDTIQPQVPYGVSKAAGEMYVRCSGLSYAILRYGNVYGPGQKPLGENILIARALAHLIDGKPFKINGDGEQLRDWIFVEDVAEANIKALLTQTSGTFNISTGKGRTVNDIVAILQRLTKNLDDIDHGPGKKGELRSVVMDPSDANSMLGWRSRVGLSEGLAKTYQGWKPSSS